jgi:hypothetical protein
MQLNAMCTALRQAVGQAKPGAIYSTQIRPYKCVYLNYQSLEDWTEGCDILRCNPNFHEEPRSDCAILDLDSDSHVFACAAFSVDR